MSLNSIWNSPEFIEYFDQIVGKYVDYDFMWDYELRLRWMITEYKF